MLCGSSHDSPSVSVFILYQQIIKARDRRRSLWKCSPTFSARKYRNFYLTTTRQVIDNYVATGKVSLLVHHDFPLSMHTYSPALQTSRWAKRCVLWPSLKRIRNCGATLCTPNGMNGGATGKVEPVLATAVPCRLRTDENWYSAITATAGLAETRCQSSRAVWPWAIRATGTYAYNFHRTHNGQTTAIFCRRAASAARS